LKTGSSTTPIAELANDYGEMGRLLMAAEYRDAAEPCFLNAQALAPDDARWPHYLAHLYRLRNEPARSAAMFERTLELRPGDAGGRGCCVLARGAGGASRVSLHESVVGSASYGCGTVRAGTHRPRQGRLLTGCEVPGRSAGSGSTRLCRPLLTGHGAPWAWRARQGRSALETTRSDRAG